MSEKNIFTVRVYDLRSNRPLASFLKRDAAAKFLLELGFAPVSLNCYRLDTLDAMFQLAEIVEDKMPGSKLLSKLMIRSIGMKHGYSNQYQQFGVHFENDPQDKWYYTSDAADAYLTASAMKVEAILTGKISL